LSFHERAPTKNEPESLHQNSFVLSQVVRVDSSNMSSKSMSRSAALEYLSKTITTTTTTTTTVVTTVKRESLSEVFDDVRCIQCHECLHIPVQSTIMQCGTGCTMDHGDISRYCVSCRQCKSVIRIAADQYKCVHCGKSDECRGCKKRNSIIALSSQDVCERCGLVAGMAFSEYEGYASNDETEEVHTQSSTEAYRSRRSDMNRASVVYEDTAEAAAGHETEEADDHADAHHDEGTSCTSSNQDEEEKNKTRKRQLREEEKEEERTEKERDKKRMTRESVYRRNDQMLRNAMHTAAHDPESDDRYEKEALIQRTRADRFLLRYAEYVGVMQLGSGFKDVFMDQLEKTQQKEAAPRRIDRKTNHEIRRYVIPRNTKYEPLYFSALLLEVWYRFSDTQQFVSEWELASFLYCLNKGYPVHLQLTPLNPVSSSSSPSSSSSSSKREEIKIKSRFAVYTEHKKNHKGVSFDHAARAEIRTVARKMVKLGHKMNAIMKIPPLSRIGCITKLVDCNILKLERDLQQKLDSTELNVIRQTQGLVFEQIREEEEKGKHEEALIEADRDRKRKEQELRRKSSQKEEEAEQESIRLAAASFHVDDDDEHKNPASAYDSTMWVTSEEEDPYQEEEEVNPEDVADAVNDDDEDEQSDGDQEEMLVPKRSISNPKKSKLLIDSKLTTIAATILYVGLARSRLKFGGASEAKKSNGDTQLTSQTWIKRLTSVSNNSMNACKEKMKYIQTAEKRKKKKKGVQ
jgi:hypothetical protein